MTFILCYLRIYIFYNSFRNSTRNYYNFLIFNHFIGVMNAKVILIHMAKITSPIHATAEPHFSTWFIKYFIITPSKNGKHHIVLFSLIVFLSYMSSFSMKLAWKISSLLVLYLLNPIVCFLILHISIFSLINLWYYFII